MDKTIALQYFTDYIWPFCYLGTVRIDRLKEDYDIQVEYIHFPLHPEIPIEGISLADYFSGRGFDIDSMNKSLKKQMEGVGLEYGVVTMIYNTRYAQELAAWAKTMETTGNIHMQLYRAYFIDNSNLSNPDLLVSIAQDVGLSGEMAREVIEKRTFKEMVDKDWQLSREKGITAVPTFITGNKRVVGFQSYEMIERQLMEFR